MNNSILFTLLEHVSNLLVMVFLIRILLQLGQADFHNPISQFLHKFTAPVLNPLRKIIPDMGRFSTSSFIVALAIIAIKFVIITSVYVTAKLPPDLIVVGVLIGWVYNILPMVSGLFMIFSNMLLILFLVLMVASFMSAGRYHPGIAFLYQVTRPILRPIQKIIPPIAGSIDLSPMIVIIGLWMAQHGLLKLGLMIVNS